MLTFIVGAVLGFAAGYLVRRNNPSDPAKLPKL
jgi:hypothetical protein